MQPLHSNASNEPDTGDMTLDEMERLTIAQSMERFDNDVSLAAEKLGISQSALYRRLKKYGIKL